MQDNPYLAPAAEVSDPITEQRADGTFLGTPQSRPAGAAVAWIGHSWRLFKASPGMWIALTLVLMGGTIALQAIPLIGGLLPGLLYPLLSAGLMFGCRDLERGQALRFHHLFAAFGERLAPLLQFTVLYFVAYSAASAAVFIPLLGWDTYLRILSGDPGNIDLSAFWLAMAVNLVVSIPILCAYWLALPLIALNQASPLSAIRLSLVGCIKNLLPLILMMFLLGLLMIAAVIPLGLGLFVVLPMLFSCMYTSYHGIFYRS